MPRLKYKYICTILLILTLFFAYLYILDNNANFDDDNFYKNLKEKFGKDLYLKFDGKVDNHFQISKIVKNLPIVKTIVDPEIIHEDLRRKAIDLYFEIKSIYIDSSIPKLIYNVFKNNFIKSTGLIKNWQTNVFGSSNSFIIKSMNKLPTQLPEIANGYLGTQVFTDEVQIQSLFSGSQLETRRASIPAWTVRNITDVRDKDGYSIVIGRRFELDMSDGTFLQIIYSNSCLVQQKLYAHQIYKSLLVHEIEVQFFNSKLNYVTILLPKGQKSDISSNIQFLDRKSSYKNHVKSVVGTTHQNDQNNHQQNVYATYHLIPDVLPVNYNHYVQKYYYLLSVNENEKISDQHFKTGISLMEQGNKLYLNHTYTWNYIWDYSGMFMKMSDDLDVPLITAQYLLITNSPSFGKTDKSGAIGASGLGVSSNQGVGSGMQLNCNGRIEYSQELWMMGYQMFMNPESVKSMLQKRLDQLLMANQNSKMFGFKGARFPAVTNELGEELCSHEFCKNMHFPTGMIALALKHYLMITGDKSMFTENTGIKLLNDIDTYWVSVFDKNNFISAGPSALFSNVRNSAFNIGLLKEVLMTLPVLYQYLDVKFSKDVKSRMLNLQNISNSIEIPFDNINNFNPPYENFIIMKDKIEYPEGVMLRYPLDALVDLDSGIRNVEVYEKRIVNNPSPMSLSTLLIGNIEAERFDISFKLQKQLLNFTNNTFKIWSNDSTLWNGSYLPSASSYVDSILYGILGLRIRKTGLYIKPQLMKPMSSIKLSCLTYFDTKIKLIVDANIGISLETIYKKYNAPLLGVSRVHDGKTVLFNEKVTFPLKSYIVIKRLKTKV